MIRILMVDDSPAVLGMLTAMLAQSGYETLTATDGEAAIRLAAEEKPDLVLLDIILPGLNGYQVSRRLKAHSETARIPIIMLTSQPFGAGQSRRVEQGVDGYLTKPFSVEQLLEAVSRFVA